MRSCDEQLRARLPARPASITTLRRAVLDFAAGCGASARHCEDIALAVSEALTNAVMHAYVGRERLGEVAVSAWAHERRLEVVVCDAGRGMRPRDDSPGMGLGLKMVEALTERLVLEDAMPGVRVRMTFAIG
jgi:anti-sigma regulatory factor (Ser/Thr protein kinase)